MKSRLKKLSDVPLAILDGDRGTNYPNKDELQEKGFCLFLNTSNVTKSGFDFSSTAFISEDKDAKLGKGKLRRDDVVMTTRGTIGNVAYYGEGVEYDHVRINSGMVILRAEAKRLHPYFLYSFLRTELFKKQTRSQGSGSAQPQLPIGSLRNIQIPELDFADQQAIGKVLSNIDANIDAKIELNQRINAELEGMAKLLYDYWFVQFDFPMTAAQAAALGKPKLAGHPYRASGGKMIYNETLKRDIPEVWTDGSLVDVATFTNGIACQKYPADGGDTLRVIKIKDMRTGLTAESDIVTANVPSKVKIKNGDILFSWSASLEVMIWAGGEGALNQHIFKVTSGTHPRSFCYFVLLDYLRHFRMMADLRKTTMGHITIDHLEQSQIAIPDDSVAEAFEVITKPIIDRMVKAHEENQELTQLRDWLLPMLMNGQVTVG